MSSQTVVALDIGGTHVSAGRVEVASATVEERLRLPFPEEAERDELVEQIVGAAAAVANGAVSRIGVAVPGPFDYDRGVSLLDHKLLPLHGVDLGRELREAFAPVLATLAFVNDADAFLLGEWWAGAARGHRRAVGITLGTGLGSAFLADGQIVDTGPDVPPEGSLHLVSYRGAGVEETISRQALVAAYGDPRLDVSDVATLARRGDHRARDGFEAFATALGEVLAPWLVSFDATCVVVGGSIARAWDLLAPGLRVALAVVEPPPAIVCSTRIDEAALLGAAWHASLPPRTG